MDLQKKIKAIKARHKAAASPNGKLPHKPPAAPKQEERHEDAELEHQPFPEPPTKEAFHGLAGEIVQVIDPHTEASRVALLLQTLVCFGNVIGRTAHFRVESTYHHLNLYACLVGRTAKGRKGTSWNRIRYLFSMVDNEWSKQRVEFGLSSAEGLIDLVKDDRWEEDIELPEGADGKRPLKLVDQGVKDKRLMVLEEEFAQVLKQTQRQGNTLSVTLRQAWDCGELRNNSKNSKAIATNVHLSAIGHITSDELQRHMNTTEQANGTGNRILWAAVERSKMLPDGGGLVDFEKLAGKLREQVSFARHIVAMPRDDEARELWHEVYPKLSAEVPGIVGALTGRAEAQTCRLACIYALLDGSFQVEAVHLRAALALWAYCERSTRFVFGHSTGDEVADQILLLLKKSKGGCTRKTIFEFFSKNLPSARITQALQVLKAANLAMPEQKQTQGRPAEIWSPGTD